MRSLQYSGPGEDGASLVVRTDDGEHFTLPVDDELREAVTGTPAPVYRPPNRGHAEGGAELSPREIQIRVRAGEAAEDLAAETGSPLDRIMRFAFPVLEERGRVADEARRSRARRDGDGALVPFGETVDSRFAVHDIDPATVGWDAVRRPDGTWLVIASWHGGDTERQAHWAFSLNARTVLPADEVAADLLSERPLRPVVQAVPDVAEDDGPTPTRPLPGGFEPAIHGNNTYDSTAYDSTVYDNEAGSYAGPPPTQAPPQEQWPPPAQWPEPPATQPGWDAPAQRSFGEDPLPPAAAGPQRLPRVEDHQTPPLPLSIDEDLDDGLDVIGTYRTGPLPTDGEIIDVAATEGDPADAERHDPADDQQAPPRRGSGRSKAAREQTKIPSWDDILLGVRRKQD